MARKTVEVGRLLYQANCLLASEQSTEAERMAMCTFIEGVLHVTGNYKGFTYLDSNQCDNSRRCYYVSTAVKLDYDKTRSERRVNLEMSS